MTQRPDYAQDTIVAAATPPGAGGLAVVRISGPLVDAIARAMLGRVPEPRYATFSAFRDGGGCLIDEGIALRFPAPRSFTGEDVLELQGHGGPVVVSGLVEAAVRLGARRAQAGEFAKRAFLNGKLDLAQAEAIADLVASGSAQAARAALRSLSGAFSDAVLALEEQLMTLRMITEASIDFPEEEIDFLADEKLAARLRECVEAFADLKARAVAGRVLRDGYRVVIAGRPNAGKSSLLNALSGQEAAIVTEIAGTTRDVLREVIDIDGLAVELVDTAGLREDPGRIEAEGIRRAREALSSADAVLWIEDAVEPSSPPDDDLPCGIPVVVVRNKVDMTGEMPGRCAPETMSLALSARTGDGLAELREVIRELAGYRDLGEGAFTARRRHIDALDRAREHLEAGRAALSGAGAGELLAEELRLSQAALKEITRGEITQGEIAGGIGSDELLGRIFAEFCIGK